MGYIRYGVVIEATSVGGMNVLKSYLINCGISNRDYLNEKEWLKYGKFKYIEY